MKTKTFLCSLLCALAASTANAGPRGCDISKVYDPDCFNPRTSPAVKVFLVQYGKAGSTLAELQRIGALLKTRFEESLKHSIEIDFSGFAVVPLKQEVRDLTFVHSEIGGTDEAMKSTERMTRLWYYYNKDINQIATEIHGEMLLQGFAPTMSGSDAILVLSEPQFEGLGYATGAFGLTEQPSEIAWSTSDGGLTDRANDPKVVDELLHELGHVLGLNHAATQCQDGSYPGTIAECCAKSPSGQDVMSYCRSRRKVSDTFFYGYTKCTQEYLMNVTRQNMLSGGPRIFQPTPCQ